MTKLTGKKFEQIFQQSCKEQGVLYVRFRDAGYQGINNSQNSQRFTIKNIADCFIFDDKQLAILELKKRDGSLPFKDITQLKELTKHSGMVESYGMENVHIGLLVCFKELESVYYVDVKAIEYLEQMTGKKSFNQKDVEKMINETMMGIKIEAFKPKGKRTLRLNSRFIEKL